MSAIFLMGPLLAIILAIVFAVVIAIRTMRAA